jgi:hypothetical protein
MAFKIMICKIGNKDGFKFGPDGFCYTYNKNQKSKLKAFESADKQRTEKLAILSKDIAL